MSSHYYSKKPEVESAPKYWDFPLRDKTYTFKTDNGVFSKKEVDFGSQLLIETFEYPNIEGPILDVGCGYGPIGISIANGTEDRIVHMVDVNERALALASENAIKNNVKNVSIYESDRFENVNENKFAAILTNPPIRAGKSVVHDIFEKSVEHLNVGGELWVVIQKKQGAPSTIEKLEELFGEVEVIVKKKGYYIIKAKK